MEIKYKTLEDRLELYKTALKDWRTPGLIRAGGFCDYFWRYHKLCTYFSFKICLPELYQQRLTEDSKLAHYPYMASHPVGRLLRRNSLISAIELTESKINKQNIL